MRRLVKKFKLKTYFYFLAAFTFLALAPLIARTQSTTELVSGGTGGSNSEEYLYYIMQNTYGILQRVNDLPTYMEDIANMALAWLSPDETEFTAQMQANFANLGNAFITNNASQGAVQPQILTDVLDNATPATMPYANDVTYQSLLGMPYFERDPRQRNNQQAINFQYNYLKNAAGANFKHDAPSPGFSGPAAAQDRYAGFYQSLMAVETFDAYTLSAAYVEAQNGGPFNTLQNTLITQASSSDWFAQVATEKIGVVLRQILMYQSQTFVLLTQLLQNQKQQLIAQAMANTLLILNSHNSEITLLQRAAKPQ